MVNVRVSTSWRRDQSLRNLDHPSCNLFLSNCSLSNSLVKLSSICFSMVQKLIMWYFSTLYLRKWYLMLMCFVLLCWTIFFLILSVLVLSPKIGTHSMPRSDLSSSLVALSKILSLFPSLLLALPISSHMSLDIQKSHLRSYY